MEPALQVPRLNLDPFVSQPKFLDPIAPPTLPFPAPTWCVLSYMWWGITTHSPHHFLFLII